MLCVYAVCDNVGIYVRVCAYYEGLNVCVCVRACVRACLCASVRVRACVRACVRARSRVNLKKLIFLWPAIEKKVFDSVGT